MECELVRYCGGSNHQGIPIVREGCTVSWSYQAWAKTTAGEGTVESARSVGYSRVCWCLIVNCDDKRLDAQCKSYCS
jgi:hypothetical protein